MGNFRATKRAKIHGSLGVGGPWTELLELSWDDPFGVTLTKETHTISETTIGFVKLEILEYENYSPALSYLRPLTGNKAISFYIIHALPVASTNSKFFGIVGSLSITADCTSGCSVFARKNGQKSSMCAQTECSASGRRRRRSTDLQYQMDQIEKRYEPHFGQIISSEGVTPDNSHFEYNSIF